MERKMEKEQRRKAGRGKMEEDDPSAYEGIKDIYRLKKQQINLHSSGRAQMSFN
jgi:hypothetical protein